MTPISSCPPNSISPVVELNFFVNDLKPIFINSNTISHYEIDFSKELSIAATLPPNHLVSKHSNIPYNTSPELIANQLFYENGPYCADGIIIKNYISSNPYVGIYTSDYSIEGTPPCIDCPFNCPDENQLNECIARVKEFFNYNQEQIQEYFDNPNNFKRLIASGTSNTTNESDVLVLKTLRSFCASNIDPKGIYVSKFKNHQAKSVYIPICPYSNSDSLDSNINKFMYIKDFKSDRINFKFFPKLKIFRPGTFDLDLRESENEEIVSKLTDVYKNYYRINILDRAPTEEEAGEIIISEDIKRYTDLSFSLKDAEKVYDNNGKILYYEFIFPFSNPWARPWEPENGEAEREITPEDIELRSAIIPYPKYFIDNLVSKHTDYFKYSGPFGSSRVSSPLIDDNGNDLCKNGLIIKNYVSSNPSIGWFYIDYIMRGRLWCVNHKGIWENCITDPSRVMPALEQFNNQVKKNTNDWCLYGDGLCVNSNARHRSEVDPAESFFFKGISNFFGTSIEIKDKIRKEFNIMKISYSASNCILSAQGSWINKTAANKNYIISFKNNQIAKVFIVDCDIGFEPPSTNTNCNPLPQGSYSSLAPVGPLSTNRQYPYLGKNSMFLYKNIIGQNQIFQKFLPKIRVYKTGKFNLDLRYAQNKENDPIAIVKGSESQDKRVAVSNFYRITINE